MKENEVKREITYNDVLNRSVLLGAIPLGGLNGRALCDIIMAQVGYGKAAADFNATMEEGLKKLKAEKCPKFDEETQKPEEERCADYAKWLDELNALYADMRNEEAKKPYGGILPKFTREMLAEVCGQGVEGDVVLPGGTEQKPNLMPRVQLLYMLAQWVE